MKSRFWLVPSISPLILTRTVNLLFDAKTAMNLVMCGKIVRCRRTGPKSNVEVSNPSKHPLEDQHQLMSKDCGEMGHTRVRCSQAPKEEVEPVGDSGDTGEVGAGGDDWKTNVAEPITAGGW